MINKIPMYKFLCWFSFFIFICFIGIFKVFALTNNNTIKFYDNAGSSLTAKTTDYNSNNDESSSVFTTTANSYGGAVIIQLSSPLIQNHIYSVFLNVGAANMGGYTVASSKNCVGIGTNYNNAINSYVNCSITPKYTQSSGQSTDFGKGLYLTFVANSNAAYLLIPYTSQNTCYDCYQFSHGYNITDGGDTTGLTQTQVNNIINQQTTTIQNQIANMESNVSNSIEESTQQQIESQKVCEITNTGTNTIFIDKSYLNNSGDVVTNSSSTNYGITNYIEINEESTINVLRARSLTSCFYSDSKAYISCISTSSTGNITIPTNAKYFRASIYKIDGLPQIQIKTCKNGNQAISDSVNDLNNSINDDNVDGATSDAGDFITGFETDTFGLTSIITAPLNLIQSLTSSTCTPLELPLPYLDNKKLTLPCMTSIYQQHFGSFFTIYQTITYGIIAYWVCVRIFNQVKDFKNPEHDEIEVVDL